MSIKDALLHLICIAMYVGALVMLRFVDWRAALGVFLFVWANNLMYTYRIKKLILNERSIRL